MKTRCSAVCLAVVFVSAVFIQGCAQKPALDLQKVADKIIQAMNSGDPVAVANMYAPDAVMIQPDQSAPVRGRDALLEYYTVAYKHMPDFKVDMAMVLFSGETIVFEGVSHGTFSAPLSTPEGEVPPTGQEVRLKFAMFAKINADGLIAEDRSYFDNLGYMKQLGVIK